jgi:ketosteroid isomerase-like protein
VSRENVDLVLAVAAAPDVDWAQVFRDDEAWATAAEVAAPFVHPDVETVFPTVPGDRTYTGLDGFRTGMLDWLAPWTTYRAEAEEAIDCGDRVLLLRRAFGRLEGSAEEVAIAGAAVVTVREGKIARIEAYADQAEALKDVGPEE